MLQQGATHLPQRARELFPSDRWLVESGIEGYSAVSLLDSQGRAIGHLGVADCAVLGASGEYEPLLGLSAALAAAELERMRAFGELKSSEERLAFAVRGSRDGIWDWVDLENDVLWWSPVLFEQLGFKDGEFTPSFERFRDLVHPEDRERTTAAVNRHLEEHVPFVIEYQVRNKSGEYRWYLGRGQAQWDSEGKPIRMTGLLQDISERKQTEATMRSLVASTVGVVGKDYFATLVSELCAYFEAECAVIAELSGGHRMRTLAVRLDGRNLPNFTYDSEGLPCDEAILRDASMFERHVRQRFPKAGEVLPLEPESFVGKRLRGRTGSTVGVIFAVSRKAMRAQPDWPDVMDILGARAAAEIERERIDAEQARLQEKLRQAQKLEGLGVLAGGIAHDFNNLLVGILGNAELGLIDAPTDSPVHESLTRIDEAAKRAAELVSQMLAYSGKGRFVVEQIELGSIVQDMARMLNLSISKRAKLVFDLGHGLPRIEADATQVRQVVMNLITNASESLAGGVGVVKLSTGVVDCDVASLADSYLDDDLPAGRYVYVQVADTGSGMDDEARGKIFDPFFTTKFTGRGLGLAAVLGIVRGHRGAIVVESQPGEGSRFRVLFPAADAGVEVQTRGPARR